MSIAKGCRYTRPASAGAVSILQRLASKYRKQIILHLSWKKEFEDRLHTGSPGSFVVFSTVRFEVIQILPNLPPLLNQRVSHNPGVLYSLWGFLRCSSLFRADIDPNANLWLLR